MGNGKANKKLTIIAGPNGSGKTTFARSYFTRESNISIFLNPDLLAAGISPLNQEQASFGTIAWWQMTGISLIILENFLNLFYLKKTLTHGLSQLRQNLRANLKKVDPFIKC